jgi:hypothetical protein
MQIADWLQKLGMSEYTQRFAENRNRSASVCEVAQTGAALGRQFSHELISAVTHIPQQQLDDALEQFVSAELIFRRRTPPDAEYTFKHALVQDAAYSTLLRSQRRQLHARIAITLEEHFREIVEMQSCRRGIARKRASWRGRLPTGSGLASSRPLGGR